MVRAASGLRTDEVVMSEVGKQLLEKIFSLVFDVKERLETSRQFFSNYSGGEKLSLGEFIL